MQETLNVRRLRVFAGIAALAAGCCLVGCKAMAAPWLMWAPEPTREVPAEYPYLPGKKVAIAIWADSEILFHFPHVQRELGEFVRVAIAEGVADVAFVPQQSVVSRQREDAEWHRRDPALVGQDLGAERLIVIELTQYTTREPDSPHLYRGRIAANVKVYNTAYPNSAPAYETALEAVYPPDSMGEWGATDAEIRRAVMQAFASDLAGRFFDRKVKLT